MSTNNISYIEQLTREYISFYFKKYKPIYNYRPDFLKNENTGKNLELDIYYPELSIAIEVNGSHKLRKARNRDLFKKRKCNEVGIKLFTIRNKYNLMKLKMEIDNYLYGYDFLGINLKQRLPEDLFKKIKIYKPDMNAFNGLGRKMKGLLKKEKQIDIDHKEKKLNLERLFRKGSITKEYFDEKMSILLKDFSI